MTNSDRQKRLNRERQARFREKMKREGFVSRTVLVHENEVPKLHAFVDSELKRPENAEIK